MVVSARFWVRFRVRVVFRVRVRVRVRVSVRVRVRVSPMHCRTGYITPTPALTIAFTLPHPIFTTKP